MGLLPTYAPQIDLKSLYFNTPMPAASGSMSTYRPTLGDRIGGGITKALTRAGVNKRAAGMFGGRAFDALNNLTPVGSAVSAEDAKRAFSAGHYASAAGNAALSALGLVPEVGKIGGTVAHSIIAPLYHGSPYKFEKFALEKIGTGEGAQAYGHGLYFAENPEVAREYAQNLGRSTNLKGASFNPDGTPNRAGYVAELLDAVGPGRIGDIEAGLRALEPHAHEKQIAAWLDEGAAKFKAADTGHLYEVKLDANPEDFLNWDAPLGQQPPRTRELIGSRLENLRANGQTLMPQYVKAFNEGALSGPQLYNGMGRGTPESSSAAWQQAGIPGIRYLDQGSRGAGQGTSNYVVFDPSIIDILNRQ